LRRAATALLLVTPGPAAAHEAFGDLGPLFQALLHPLADPAQGLLLVAAAVFLARQPLATVRPAFAALVAGGLGVLATGLVVTLPDPGLRFMTLAALGLALVALPVRRAPVPAAVALAFAVGGLAALPFDAAPDGRSAVLGLLGGAAGIALGTLFLWGAADWADRRLSPLVSTVAAAWVAAIALMAAALPA
jgi:hypothetical protein